MSNNETYCFQHVKIYCPKYMLPESKTKTKSYHSSNGRWYSAKLYIGRRRLRLSVGPVPTNNQLPCKTMLDILNTLSQCRCLSGIEDDMYSIGGLYHQVLKIVQITLHGLSGVKALLPL